jgi:hypothetical protein
MLGKAEEKRQVAEEVEEQDGALPEDWRGEVIGMIGTSIKPHVEKISPVVTMWRYRRFPVCISCRFSSHCSYTGQIPRFVSNHNPGETYRGKNGTKVNRESQLIFQADLVISLPRDQQDGKRTGT